MFATTTIAPVRQPSPAIRHRTLAALIGLGLLCAAPPPLAAQSVEAAVDLTALLCNVTTAEPFSDEPFIVGTWVNAQTGANGKIYVPSPVTGWIQQLQTWVTLYPKFGNVDDNSWAITTDRRVFRGWIGNGQTVIVALKFWEGDSNYTLDDYARDMRPVVRDAAVSLALGASVSWVSVAQTVYFSAKYLFGWGADDFLGSMTFKLTNVNGQLSKQIEATRRSSLGGTYYYDYRFASYLDTAGLNYLLSTGYQIVSLNTMGSTISWTYTLRKANWYGTISGTGRTIRTILDGDGAERYHASMTVRRGPFNSTTPDGTLTTWVQDSTYRAH